MANPELPPRWRRLYAHVINLEVACPNCGRMTGSWKGWNRAYDWARAQYRCPRCNRVWYVGVVFWPLARQRPTRPWDHVPTPGEAMQLRELALSGVERVRVAGVRRDVGSEARVRVQVNLVCTCGACPVHAPEGIGGDDDEIC